MRCTFGTVAALAATFLIATAFWPETPQGPLPARSVAQAPAAVATTAEPTTPASAPSSAKLTEERIQATLDRATEVNFLETPLEEAINYLKEYHQINIWIDRQAVADTGASLDQPISIQLQNVTFRSTLKLILEPLYLDYVIEDEVMKITSATKAIEVIRVYDISDLVRDGGSQPVTTTAATTSAGESLLEAARAAGAVRPGAASSPPGAAAPSSGKKQLSRGRASGGSGASFVAGSIAEVVARTIVPESWELVGKDGVVMEYNGLLIVRNSRMVHDRIEKLLDMMRKF